MAVSPKSMHFDIDYTFEMSIKRPAPSNAVEELQARIAYLEEKFVQTSFRYSDEEWDDIGFRPSAETFAKTASCSSSRTERKR